MQALTVTLTLKVATQYYRVTLGLLMMYTSYKVLLHEVERFIFHTKPVRVDFQHIPLPPLKKRKKEKKKKKKKPRHINTVKHTLTQTHIH